MEGCKKKEGKGSDKRERCKKDNYKKKENYKKTIMDREKEAEGEIQRNKKEGKH